MPKYKIPDSYKKGFSSLFELDGELRARLIEELKNTSDTLTLHDLTYQLRNTLKIEASKVDEIIRSLIGLLSLKESSNLDIITFVNEIEEALKNTEEKSLQPPANFNSQLQALLNVDESPFYVRRKAIRLATERERILTNARIITDVRPIFDDEKISQIKASLISHNLKIEYIESDELKEIYFALDKEDLSKLKQIIERAEQKEKALKEELSKIDIKFIDYR